MTDTSPKDDEVTCDDLIKDPFFYIAILIAIVFCVAIVIFFVRDFFCCPYFKLVYAATWAAAVLLYFQTYVPEISKMAISARIVTTILTIVLLIFTLPTTEPCVRDWLFYMSVTIVFILAAQQAGMIAYFIGMRCS